MIAADVGRAALVASIPLAYGFGILTLGQLYVVAFLAGTLSTLFEVANSSLFVSLVPRARLVQANSLVNGSRAMSFVAGPSLGGLLVQALTAPVALVVDAVSYLASAVQLGRVAPAEPPPQSRRPGDFTAGLRFLAASRLMWTYLVAAATVNFFNFMFWALVILYITVDLGISAGLLGLVIGAGAVGALIGSVVTGRLTRAIGIGPSYVVGLLAFPAPLLLVPLASGPRPAVLALRRVARPLPHPEAAYPPGALRRSNLGRACSNARVKRRGARPSAPYGQYHRKAQGLVAFARPQPCEFPEFAPSELKAYGRGAEQMLHGRGGRQVR
jgi:predicted MFS family arabinose efflux permease